METSFHPLKEQKADNVQREVRSGGREILLKAHPRLKTAQRVDGPCIFVVVPFKATGVKVNGDVFGGERKNINADSRGGRGALAPEEECLAVFFLLERAKGRKLRKG